MNEKTPEHWSGAAAAVPQLFSWAALPAVCALAGFSRKHRLTLAERLGGGGWRQPLSGETIWIHGASVGEITGITPLLEKLRAAFPSHKLLATATSLTGREKAASLSQVDAARIFPYDNRVLHERLLRQIDCRLVIVAETEIWPNFLYQLQRRRIPTLLVNARISDYTFDNYYRLRRFIGPALSSFAHILAQTELDAERFIRLGAQAAGVEVSGSTKYDRAPESFDEQALDRFAAELGIDRARPCFVAGSVRPGEEQIVIDAYLAARTQVPGLQLILAPRHPERFAAAAKLLEASGLDFSRRSQSSSLGKPVLLLDSMGELARCYALASFAFVGATLVDIGGHNPFEPASFHKPVIVGPYVATIRDAVESLRSAGGLFEVSNGGELQDAVLRLSQDRDLRTGCGEAAFRAWEKNLGATARVMERICRLLGESGKQACELACAGHPPAA